MENYMAFINKEVPVDEKKTYDFRGFQGPFGPCKPEDLGTYMWTIDRERNAFLLATGGGGGQHQGVPRREWYGLYWDGAVAHFSGDFVVSRDPRGQLLTWEQPKFIVPSHSQKHRSEWVALLKEALDVQGLYFDRSNIYTVNVVVE
jgi:hypothetical protein